MVETLVASRAVLKVSCLVVRMVANWVAKWDAQKAVRKDARSAE